MIERVTSGVRRFTTTRRLERHLRTLFAAGTAVASAGLAACAGPMDGALSGPALSGQQPVAATKSTLDSAALTKLALGIPPVSEAATQSATVAAAAADEALHATQGELQPAAITVPAPANDFDLKLPDDERVVGKVVTVDVDTAVLGPAAILLRHDIALTGQDFDRRTAYIRANLDSLRRVLDDGRTVKPRSDSDYHEGRYVFVRPAAPGEELPRPATSVAAAPQPPMTPVAPVAAALVAPTLKPEPTQQAVQAPTIERVAPPAVAAKTRVVDPSPQAVAAVVGTVSNDNRADTPPALVGGPATPHMLVSARDASMGPQHIARAIARAFERETGTTLPTVDWRLLVNAEQGLTYSDQSANRAVRPGLHLLARNRDEFNWLRRVYQERTVAAAPPERKRLSLALEREYSPRLSAELERKAMILASDSSVWDATFTLVSTQSSPAGALARHLEDHALMLPDARMRVISRLAVQIRAETEARPVAKRLRQTAFPREIQTEIAGIGAGMGLQITPADYQIALQDIETRLVSYADLLRLTPDQAVSRLISAKDAVGPNQVINEWMRDRRREGMAVNYVEDTDVLRQKLADLVSRARQMRASGMDLRRAGRWLEEELKAVDDRFNRERMSVITSRQFIQTVRAFADMDLAPEAQMHFAIEAYLRGLSNAQKLARDYVGNGVAAGMSPEEFLQARRLRDGYGAKKLAHLRVMDAERRAGVQVAEAPPADVPVSSAPIQVAMAAPPAEISALVRQQREAESFRQRQGTERPTLPFAERSVTGAARAIVSNYGSVTPTAERRSMVELEQAARVMWAERENGRVQSTARREQLRTLLEMVVEKLEAMPASERGKYLAQVQELHELSLRTLNAPAGAETKPGLLRPASVRVAG
jgi:hypothetical protein